MKKALLRSKTETVYDITLDEHKYFFKGDRVLGRLIIIPSKPYKITGIRLEFFGRIKTYINSKKQDGHYFFKELFPLDVQTGTLQEGKTYTFPFEFNLPVDVSLPSCTESDTNAGGMIEYVITATMERPSREWSALTASVHIPVLERLDVSKTELQEPVWDKVSWQSQHPEDIIDADEYQGVDQVDLSASIPHRGYTRDQKIPVTVDIQHFQPYQRTNGLTISLIRCTRVLCKEKAYLLSPTIVSSTKVNIDIQQSTTQTITESVLIPRHISPTINLNARLMQVDYRIEIRAELDEPDRNNSNSGNIASFLNTTADKRHLNMDLASMILELPIVIGTLPSPSTPPDVLDPKFVKGVKHIGQENKSNQQQQERQPSRFSSSFSALASLDLGSIPSGLREIATTNLRWDQSSARRQSDMTRPQQQPRSSSSSWRDESTLSPTKSPLNTTINSSTSSSKIPTTPTTSSAPTTTIPTYRSSLVGSSTMASPPSSSTPVYRSDLSETTPPTVTTTTFPQLHLPSSSSPSSPSSPFYLTLSLGEPFDLLQSGFTDNDRYSIQSTGISASSKSSLSSSKGMEKEKLTPPSTAPFTSGAHTPSIERLINDSSSSSSSTSHSSMELNNSVRTPTTTTTSTAGPSLRATLNQNSDYLYSSDTSSSVPSSRHSSLGATSTGLTVTAQPTDTDTIAIRPIDVTTPPSPPLASVTEVKDTLEHVSVAESSHCDTPKTSIDSNTLLISDSTTQPNEPMMDADDMTETNTPIAAHGLTSSAMAAVDETNGVKDAKQESNCTQNLDPLDDDTTTAVNKAPMTITIKHEEPGHCTDTVKELNQVKISDNTGQNNSNGGLFMTNAGVYRQVSTDSHYRQQQTYSGPLDKNKQEHDDNEQDEESTYKPESTIEGLDISAAVIEPVPIDTVTTSNQEDENPVTNNTSTTTMPTRTTKTDDDEKPTNSNSIILRGESDQQSIDEDSDLFDKPHEMAYSDSDDDDDDDDDFLSILARREKQAESSYWQ